MEEERTQLGWPQVAWCSSELLVVKIVVVHIHMAKKHKIRYIFRPFKIHKKKNIQCSSKTLTKKHDKLTREGNLVQLSN